MCKSQILLSYQVKPKNKSVNDKELNDGVPEDGGPWLQVRGRSMQHWPISDKISNGV